VGHGADKALKELHKAALAFFKQDEEAKRQLSLVALAQARFRAQLEQEPCRMGWKLLKDDDGSVVVEQLNVKNDGRDVLLDLRRDLQTLVSSAVDVIRKLLRQVMALAATAVRQRADYFEPHLAKPDISLR
jgi:hypothetical protein